MFIDFSGYTEETQNDMAACMYFIQLVTAVLSNWEL